MISNSIPVYVINMKSNIDRMQNVTDQLNQLNISFERVDAVAGGELTSEQVSDCYDSSVNEREHHRNLTRGELGCYLSHRKIWQKMVSNGIEKVLILEDDINVQPVIWDAIKIANQSAGWEVMKIADHDNVNAANSKKVNEVMTLVSYNKVPNRTMGYFITETAAKKMLSLRKVFRPIDIDFQFYKYFNVTVCGLMPNSIEANPETGQISDIVKQNKGQHSQHSTFLRNLKYRFKMYINRKYESYKIENFSIHK